MTKLCKFKVNKLVRDKTLELLTKQRIISNFRVFDETEFLLSLKEKLLEESKEVFDTNSTKEAIDELARS